jgi:hypothetical protein
LAEAGAVDADLALADRLRIWLIDDWEPRHGALISLPDIYSDGPAPIRDAKTARRMVAILENHGWLVRISQSTCVRGKPRKECWRIITGGET